MPLIASPRADRHFGSTISWNYGASWKSTKRARGEGRMCKYNIAAYDRRTLPHRNRPEKVQLLDIYRLFPDSVRIKRGSFYGAAAKGCILFYSTADACMRHNDIYMRRPDGQTKKARSENAGSAEESCNIHRKTKQSWKKPRHSRQLGSGLRLASLRS